MKIKNCVFATMLFAFIVFANDTFTVKYVNSPSDGYLNLRAGAAANTALVMPVPHGAAVNVFNEGGQGNWARVSYQDRVGFMSRNFLSDTQQRGGANMPVISHVTDPRDNKTYRTTRIGNLTWMAENLNFEIKNNSWCYENNAANCNRYGRLYDWNTALNVCPAGWRLPSDNDWNALINFVGQSVADTKLKSKSGWNNNNNGTDDFGFSAIPSGYRSMSVLDGSIMFADVGYRSFWWTSSEIEECGDSGTCGGSRVIHYDFSGMNLEGGAEKTEGFSVRCVRD